MRVFKGLPARLFWSPPVLMHKGLLHIASRPLLDQETLDNTSNSYMEKSYSSGHKIKTIFRLIKSYNKRSKLWQVGSHLFSIFVVGGLSLVRGLS